MKYKFAIGSLIVLFLLLSACGGNTTQASLTPTQLPTQTQVVVPTEPVQQISLPQQTPTEAPSKVCVVSNYGMGETLTVAQYSSKVEFHYKSKVREFFYTLLFSTGKVSPNGDESDSTTFKPQGDFSLVGMPAGNYNQDSGVFTESVDCR